MPNDPMKDDDTVDYPVDPCLVPPGAAIASDDPTPPSLCFLCMHPITEHSQRNQGCGVFGCFCKSEFGR